MFTIKEASPVDAQALLELYMEHLTTNQPTVAQDISKWEDMIMGFVLNPDYHLLIGFEDGRVVSSVTIVTINNLTHNLRPYAVIENVVTHAQFRERGYAGGLIDKACDIAKESGCYKVMLMTGADNESTFRFYENHGFNANDKTAFVKWL